MHWLTGQKQETKSLGASGEKTTDSRPVRDPATWHVTAGHGHIGPLVHGGHQVGHHFGWVLTVAVDRAERVWSLDALLAASA